MKRNRSLQIGKQQQGFAVLFVSAVLLIAATMLSFLLSGAVVSLQRNVGNEYRMEQSFNAAQTGLEYTIAYLDTNYDTLTDGETLTASLSDGSSYSSVITFQGDKNLIKIVSTGTSADNTSTHVVSQLVSYVSEGGAVVSGPVTAKGAVQMSSNARVVNTESDNTITSGGAVTLTSNAKTVLSSGTASTSGNLGSDIVQNNATIGNITDEALQESVLSGQIANYSITPDITYEHSSNYNYNSELNGVEGQKIQLNQNGSTASVGSNATIGSVSNPVTLYVDGNFELASNVKIYGNIYATGNIDLKSNTTIYGNVSGQGDAALASNVVVYGNVIVIGQINLSSNATVEGLVFALSPNGITLESNAAVYGGLISNGPLIMKSNAVITYDSDNIQGENSSEESSYVKVPGSWNDLNQ